MSIAGLTSSGSIPALEATIQFAGARQRTIAHNIANIDTPDFQPLDLSVTGFQKSLADAIDRRRAGDAPEGPLELRDSSELRVDHGQLRFTPKSPSTNLLFHDRNNRDLEHLMQASTENVSVYRTATELLRSRYDLLKTAISQRV